MQQVDLAIVGAGIMGLAHAYHAAKAGLSVAVFERDARASGASTRNFGMLAVIAQAPGPQLDAARRALSVWQDLAAAADIAIEPSGCLFVARQPEELRVLEEFAATAIPSHHDAALIARDDLTRLAPNLRTDAILGGLYSADAWKVDQRQASARIADWLHRAHGVAFHFSTPVEAINPPQLETPGGQLTARHIILCGGDEFAALYPNAYAETGVSRCQLQMLRTAPQPKGWRLKPFLLGGLSMTRYNVFADCPGLPALVQRQRETQAEHLSHGIHVIACQEPDGSITIGDSHVYGDAIPPERSEHADRLILDELAGMIALPDPQIAQRWLGHYAHLPGTEALHIPVAPGVTAVTMTNGQGMTHAFAVAETVIGDLTAR